MISFIEKNIKISHDKFGAKTSSIPERPLLLATPLSVWVASVFHCCHDPVFQNLRLPS